MLKNTFSRSFSSSLAVFLQHVVCGYFLSQPALQVSPRNGHILKFAKVFTQGSFCLPADCIVYRYTKTTLLSPHLPLSHWEKVDIAVYCCHNIAFSTLSFPNSQKLLHAIFVFVSLPRWLHSPVRFLVTMVTG